MKSIYFYKKILYNRIKRLFKWDWTFNNVHDDHLRDDVLHQIHHDDDDDDRFQIHDPYDDDEDQTQSQDPYDDDVLDQNN